METQSIPWREKVQLIVRFLRGSIHYFVVALLCACLGMVFNALTPQVIRLTVDSILGAEQPSLPAFLQPLLPLLQAQKLHALWLAAAAVLLLALLRGFCNYGQRTQLSRGSESFVKRIRDGLYDHIQHLSFSWHTAHSTGEIIQRCTSDVDVIRTFVCNQLVEVVRTVFLIILYLVIMFRMNVRLSFVALAFIPIVGLSSGVFYRRISGRFQAADEAEGDLTTCAQENLTGVRVVRAFGRERFETDRFCEKNEKFAQPVDPPRPPALGLLGLRHAADVPAGHGHHRAAASSMAVHGNMTLGEFLAFISYNEALSWPVRSLGRVLSDMSKAGVSLDRVGYILRAAGGEGRARGRAAQRGRATSSLTMSTFGYGETPVLQDVSFTIPHGSTFAILGGTGSRQEHARASARPAVRPAGSGRITIGGVDIRSYTRESTCAAISALCCRSRSCFSQTMRENIAAIAQPGAPQRGAAQRRGTLPAWTRPSATSRRAMRRSWASAA